MKLTHIAHGLTLILIVVTAWLAFQANEESKKANAKMDRLTAQATSMGTFRPDAVETNGGSMLPSAAVIPTATPPTASVSPGSASSVPAVPPPVMPAATPEQPTAAALAREVMPPASSPVAAPVAAAVPGVLTPLQKRVKEAPSLGKVQDFVAEHGFVTFNVVEDSGLKPGMKFDLRRDAAVVGRITIEAVEGKEVIANLDPKSVPAGVAVQKGDDIISVVMVQAQ